MSDRKSASLTKKITLHIIWICKNALIYAHLRRESASKSKVAESCSQFFVNSYEEIFNKQFEIGFLPIGY
jgi:hypothetical protein